MYLKKIICKMSAILSLHKCVDMMSLASLDGHFPWNPFPHHQHSVQRMSQIALFTGPTWVLWAPCWPHAPCYQGCLSYRALFNIKTIFPRYWNSPVKDKTVARPSYLKHGDPILVRHLYIETAPRSSHGVSVMQTFGIFLFCASKDPLFQHKDCLFRHRDYHYKD